MPNALLGRVRLTCGRAGPIPRYQRISSAWTRLRGYGEASPNGKSRHVALALVINRTYHVHDIDHGPVRSPHRATRPRLSIPLTVD